MLGPDTERDPQSRGAAWMGVRRAWSAAWRRPLASQGAVRWRRNAFRSPKGAHSITMVSTPSKSLHTVIGAEQTVFPWAPFPPLPPRRNAQATRVNLLLRHNTIEAYHRVRTIQRRDEKGFLQTGFERKPLPSCAQRQHAADEDRVHFSPPHPRPQNWAKTAEEQFITGAPWSRRSGEGQISTPQFALPCRPGETCPTFAMSRHAGSAGSRLRTPPADPLPASSQRLRSGPFGRCQSGRSQAHRQPPAVTWPSNKRIHNCQPVGPGGPRRELSAQKATKLHRDEGDRTEGKPGVGLGKAGLS